MADELSATELDELRDRLRSLPDTQELELFTDLREDLAAESEGPPDRP